MQHTKMCKHLQLPKPSFLHGTSRFHSNAADGQLYFFSAKSDAQSWADLGCSGGRGRDMEVLWCLTCERVTWLRSIILTRFDCVTHNYSKTSVIKTRGTVHYHGDTWKANSFQGMKRGLHTRTHTHTLSFHQLVGKVKNESVK